MNILEELRKEYDNYMQIAEQNSKKSRHEEEVNRVTRHEYYEWDEIARKFGKAAGYASAAASLRFLIERIENEQKLENSVSQPSSNSSGGLCNICSSSGGSRTENSHREATVLTVRGSS